MPDAGLCGLGLIHGAHQHNTRSRPAESIDSRVCNDKNGRKTLRCVCGCWVVGDRCGGVEREQAEATGTGDAGVGVGGGGGQRHAQGQQDQKQTRPDLLDVVELSLEGALELVEHDGLKTRIGHNIGSQAQISIQ